VSRPQFILLNIVGGLCGLLILGDLVLGLLNGRLNQTVTTNQTQFGQAQQLQNTARNLVMRIARSAETEPALRELLAKHDFHVSTNPPARRAP
jgi:hypothetical protein